MLPIKQLGFNNTPSEAVARQVQIIEDLGHKGPAVAFVWPSAATPSGYLYDRDSALHARDALASFLSRLRRAWPGEIIVIAHSLGGFLTMEALGRLRRSGKRGALVDGLVLAQPDISLDVFRVQVADAAPLPARTVLMVSEDDPALRLSALLSRQPERLGATHERETYRLLGMSVIDLTGVRDAQERHLVAFTSPTVLARLRDLIAENRIPAL